MRITGPRIILLTALFQFLLAINCIWGSANAVQRWEEWGLSKLVAGAVFAACGVLLMVQRDSVMFIAATLPYILFVLTTIIVSLEDTKRVPTSAILIYMYSIVQMYALYIGECLNGTTS